MCVTGRIVLLVVDIDVEGRVSFGRKKKMVFTILEFEYLWKIHTVMTKRRLKIQE